MNLEGEDTKIHGIPFSSSLNPADLSKFKVLYGYIFERGHGKEKIDNLNNKLFDEFSMKPNFKILSVQVNGD